MHVHVDVKVQINRERRYGSDLTMKQYITGFSALPLSYLSDHLKSSIYNHSTLMV